MTAYYNEIDPYAAQWLRNLIAAGHIATGDVDERSIVDVRPDDLRGYTQCHFFAGIGGWDAALTLAGWQFDGRVTWTGSCPCQPFSAAGKNQGGEDERHLWPHWFRLIRECRPAIVFGEQVEAAIGWGWLDAVLGDLEAAAGYATGAAVLGAHSVGAPHIRQRLWFVADADGSRPLDDEQPAHGRTATAIDERGATGGLVGDATDKRREGRIAGRRVAGSGCWDDLVWLPCTDGKARPTQPGLFPLAHGVPARMGKLRAAGNAIVPQVAAEFIRACTG